MQVARAWPPETPLQMLHSGRHHDRWGRWSILASPECGYRFDGRSGWYGETPPLFDITFSHDPLRDLDTLLDTSRLDPVAADVMSLPFAGGWLGYFSYDLGRHLEPVAQHRSPPVGRDAWPLIELAWCPTALVHDHRTGTWYEIGRTGLIDELTQRLDSPAAYALDAFQVGELHSNVTREAYLQCVKRTIEYIAAGDVFQANITQRFRATFEGSTRSLWDESMRSSRAWFGASMEFEGVEPGESRRLISISPELFLQVDPESRRVVTRPIKGTRPASRTADELRRSGKDQAELNMIIDLMRNDLGRVCEYGTVHVPAPRQIETHPTVHHGVGEVQGVLRGDATFGDLLGATFPGGSVTGAPKIRAMQIIDELEEARRGPYCGAVGYLSVTGHVALNIAIRTLLLNGHRDDTTGIFKGGLDYGAGGGIVADSVPHEEYRESLDKTEVLRLALARRTQDIMSGSAG
jgi:anthranilate/para-aminobenzoate synthase component I